jgi:hypothetical protein
MMMGTKATRSERALAVAKSRHRSLRSMSVKACFRQVAQWAAFSHSAFQTRNSWSRTQCDRCNEFGSGRELLMVDALFDLRHKSWGVPFH